MKKNNRQLNYVYTTKKIQTISALYSYTGLAGPIVLTTLTQYFQEEGIVIAWNAVYFNQSFIAL